MDNNKEHHWHVLLPVTPEGQKRGEGSEEII